MKSLKNRTIGFYIQAAIPLLCLVSLVAYLVYASALGKYDVKVILGLGIGCALSTVQFWVKTGIIELILFRHAYGNRRKLCRLFE